MTAIHVPPHEMLETFDGINVAAPMVRYSKLPFRHLVSRHECHITHTPMILASEFSRSSNARLSDFSTSVNERGSFLLVEKRSSGPSEESEIGVAAPRRHLVRGSLIAQFAANDPRTFADAVELIFPYVDGVDLNCGCPQEWAYKEQIGCWLLRKPDTVRDIIRAAKARVGSSFPISVKVRVDEDLKHTYNLIQTAIQAGVSHISVHGRTRHQASSIPVSLPSIAFAVEAANGAVPIVANGDAWSLTEAENIREATKASGVMSARGLLANPALFEGHLLTPPKVIQEFVQLATDYGLLFPLFHRHLGYMLEARFTRQEHNYFNSLGSCAGVIDHLRSRGLEW
ncbi:FMN-linked oxidoreductase [Rickenella mellea]|uniref:tRNA-dihydrouridine synthase n=1 Tax=Rickenella mellea TaxID=50990 RepID=A0A4Y7QHZ8_9AGAM|nr:FMN-linked oxidoreductase [Rickenella mellea]